MRQQEVDQIVGRAWQLREEFRQRENALRAEFPTLLRIEVKKLATLIDRESTLQNPDKDPIDMEGEYELDKLRRVAKRTCLKTQMLESIANRKPRRLRDANHDGTGTG